VHVSLDSVDLFAKSISMNAPRTLAKTMQLVLMQLICSLATVILDSVEQLVQTTNLNSASSCLVDFFLLFFLVFVVLTFV